MKAGKKPQTISRFSPTDWMLERAPRRHLRCVTAIHQDSFLFDAVIRGDVRICMINGFVDEWASLLRNAYRILSRNFQYPCCVRRCLSGTSFGILTSVGKSETDTCVTFNPIIVHVDTNEANLSRPNVRNYCSTHNGLAFVPPGAARYKSLRLSGNSVFWKAGVGHLCMQIRPSRDKY